MIMTVSVPQCCCRMCKAGAENVEGAATNKHRHFCQSRAVKGHSAMIIQMGTCMP